MSKHKELKEEYLALTGKKPKIMSTENLAKTIQKLKENSSLVNELGKDLKIEGLATKVWDEMTDEERMEEAKRINSQAKDVRWTEEELVPVWLNGDPHAIIDNEYIPWDKAQIIWQERIVERETTKLKYLKSLSK